MPRSSVVLVLALLFVACSGLRAAEAAPAAGAVPIAIVPAQDPPTYTFTADSGITMLLPAASGGLTPDRRPKGEVFTARLVSAGFDPGRQLTEAVAEALRARGHPVRVLPSAGAADDSARKPPRPGDAVLRLTLAELGFHTPAMSLECLPRLSATAVLSVVGRKAPLYDATLHYGVDARPGAPWAIVADRRFAYPGLDAVLNQLDSVKAGFGVGLRQLGARMAQQIDAALH